MTVIPAINYFSRRNTAEDRGGSYVDGRWVEASATPYGFTGVLNPASAKDLEVLPEGDRSKDIWVTVTRAVFNFKQADGRADDTSNGTVETYIHLPDSQFGRVIMKKDWRHRGFYKYWIERITDWDDQ